MVRIGIDIGGTKVNMGLLHEDGSILAKKKLKTADAQSPRELVSMISHGTEDLLRKNGFSMQDVAFIGAGVPGTVDYKSGMVSFCPNLQWFDVPIGDYFRQDLGREVLVFQDSRNGALAEKLFGAGKDSENLICITIGTGIGCGIILGGKVLHGAMNSAGELGHITLVQNGRECGCGNKGCLEAYVSGTAIGKRATEAYPEKFAGAARCEDVFALAYQGDRDMLALIDSAMEDLACGLANAVNLFSPDMIIISGGLSEHKQLVIEALQNKIAKRGYYSWARLNRLRVVPARLGSDAPMIGAAFIDKSL